MQLEVAKDSSRRRIEREPQQSQEPLSRTTVRGICATSGKRSPTALRAQLSVTKRSLSPPPRIIHITLTLISLKHIHMLKISPTQIDCDHEAKRQGGSKRLDELFKWYSGLSHPESRGSRDAQELRFRFEIQITTMKLCTNSP